MSRDVARPPRGSAGKPGLPTKLDGLPRLYSYDNVNESSSGQAALATLADYYGKNPYNLQRSVRGKGPGDDGNLHFDNAAFVGAIEQRFPSTDILPRVKAMTRETMLRAFETFGLRTDEGYPGAFSDGEEAQGWLVDWIQRHREPILVLVDMFAAERAFQGAPWFTYHWGIVHAVDAQCVHLASWHTSVPLPWRDFMNAWQCKQLAYPNNYYQLRVWS